MTVEEKFMQLHIFGGWVIYILLIIIVLQLPTVFCRNIRLDIARGLDKSTSLVQIKAKVHMALHILTRPYSTTALVRVLRFLIDRHMGKVESLNGHT